MNTLRHRSHVRIVSNRNWFDGVTIGGEPVEAIHTRDSAPGTLKSVWRGLSADAVVINEAHRELMAFCLARRLTGRPKRIIAVDQILQPARDTKSRRRIAVWRSLLREVSHFVFHYRDTDEVAELYGLPKKDISYVPFKVNGLEDIRRYATRDEGYVLACGRSRRDYVSFCGAMAQLSADAVILAPIGEETKEHGTVDELTNVPSNVRLVHDDGSWESWLRWIGGARLVVIPILPPTLAASGIGTYLVAMALGKCVVITDSLASRGILTENEAVVVPPLDVAGLRDGIKSVLDDPALRERIAEGGRAYALSLGDESRLAADMVATVARVLGISDRAPEAFQRAHANS
jgi:glycosyltransferase involved in cell wall biosynthesis